jgi:hypothetical protein
LGDAFHLQQTLWFREPPKEHCSANSILDVTVAVAVYHQLQHAGPYVTIFSHGTLHFTLHVPWGKALYCVRKSCHKTVTIGSAAAVVIAFPSGWTALRYRILNRVSHSALCHFLL